MGGRGAASRSGVSASSADTSKYLAKPSPYDAVTRKQGGMVFAAYKNGNLNATKNQISMMYERYVADGARPTTNSTSINVASKLRSTINAISAKDYKAANSLFSSFIDTHYRSFNDSSFPDDRKSKKR